MDARVRRWLVMMAGFGTACAAAPPIRVVEPAPADIPATVAAPLVEVPPVSARLAALEAFVASVDGDGLDPGSYGVAAARALFEGAGADPRRLAEVELVVASIALTLCRDLAAGRVTPGAVDSSWTAAQPRPEARALLAQALDGGDLAAALAGCRPPHAGYERLREAMSAYRRLAAGGWDQIGPGASLALGATGQRVARLRARLAATDGLPPTDAAGEAFDVDVERAVRRFQERHGLPATGVVDGPTQRALDVPVAGRIRQLAANLERWRWLPRDTRAAGPAVWVNVATAELELIERGRAPVTMRVIVGRPDWPTPIVSGSITRVVFGPAWYVPQRIAVTELLPLVRADPTWPARHGYRVYRNGATPVEVAPDSVDWSLVSDSAPAYRFVQPPGPANPLGGVKFDFANPFNTYLHDTPARELFAQPVRTLSHGCVRVERAAELAARLLGIEEQWTPEAVAAAMAAALTQGGERVVALPAPVPVHLVYGTAWVSPDGVVHFAADRYGWDKRLGEASLALQPDFRRGGAGLAQGGGCR